MDNELEVIQSQMEETRASLAEKLDALENKVLGSVEDTASAVASTVDTVQATVKSIKDVLDVRKHVQNQPWAMVGGAVGLGFLGGLLLPSSKTQAAAAPGPAPAFSPTAYPPREEEPGPLGALFQSLKGMALGAIMQTVRDMATKALPASMAPDVVAWVDDLSAKIGAKPSHAATPTPGAPSSAAGDQGPAPSRKGEWGHPERKKANGASGEKSASSRGGFKPR